METAEKSGTYRPILPTLVRRLQACKGAWARISRETKVSHGTVVRIATGVTKAPSIKSVDAIMRWLDRNPETAKAYNEMFGYERFVNRKPAKRPAKERTDERTDRR